EYKDHLGRKTTAVHCDVHAQEVYNYFRREASEAREETERRKEEAQKKAQERAKQERKRQEREKNKTCCRVCGKKFCSKYCTEQHQLPKCDDCGEKCFTTSYYKDAANKTGTLCVGCHTTHKSKKSNLSDPSTPIFEPKPKKPTSSPQQTPQVTSEGGNSNQPTSDPKSDSPSSPSSPTDNLRPNSSNSSNNFFTPAPSSEGSDFYRCSICDKDFSADNDHNKNSSCAQKAQEAEKIFKKIEAGQKISSSEVNNLDLPTDKKIFLQTVQKISQGEKVNIDNLNLSDEAKEELRRIRDNYQNKYSETLVDESESPTAPFYIGLFVIFVVILAVIIIRKRKKRQKKK
ncbi:165_t:CDS:2, partial [Ambispora gerdemannii]